MSIYVYTTLDDPLATGGTSGWGINATGQIVGQYNNASGTHGFLYSGGTYTTLDDPLANNGTYAYGINGAGQVVGWYQVGGTGIHGFIESGGSYTSIDDPSATQETEARLRRHAAHLGRCIDAPDEPSGHPALRVSAARPNAAPSKPCAGALGDPDLRIAPAIWRPKQERSGICVPME